MTVFYQLLRDGAAALLVAARFYIRCGRCEYAAQVYAVMAVKAGILRCDKGVFHIRRKLGEFDEYPALTAACRKGQFVIGVVNAQAFRDVGYCLRREIHHGKIFEKQKQRKENKRCYAQIDKQQLYKKCCADIAVQDAGAVRLSVCAVCAKEVCFFVRLFHLSPSVQSFSVLLCPYDGFFSTGMYYDVFLRRILHPKKRRGGI